MKARHLHEKDPFDEDDNLCSECGGPEDDEECEMDVPTEPYGEDEKDDPFAEEGRSSAFPAASSTASAAELAVAAARQAHEQEQRRQAEAKAKQEAKEKREAKERRQAKAKGAPPPKAERAQPPKAEEASLPKAEGAPPPKSEGAPPPKAEAPPNSKGAPPQGAPPPEAEAPPKSESAPPQGAPPAPPPKAEAPSGGAPKAEGAPAQAMPATFAGRYPPQNDAAAQRFLSEQQQWYHIRSMWNNDGLRDGMNQNESQRSFYQFMRMHARLTDADYYRKAEKAWPLWKREHPVLPKI